MPRLETAVLVALFFAPLTVATHAAPASIAPNSEVQGSEAQGSTARDDTAGKEAERRRILHLAGGQSIRKLSRWTGDHWEFKEKDTWKPLDAQMVVGAALESDVLKEWHAMHDHADLRKADARAQLASWAATAGLMNEALEEVDGALAVLRSHWFFTVPSLAVSADKLDAAEDQVMRLGAQIPGASREVVALELAKHPDRDRLRERLAKELRSNVVTRRAFASLALRRAFPGELVKPLVMHAVLDPSEEVRTGSALALRAAHEPGVCVPIVKVMLESKSGKLRTNAAEALGHMGYSAAVEPLVDRLMMAAAPGGGDSNRIPHANIFVGRQVAYIQDFDVQVAQFQAVADPQVNVLIEGSVQDSAVVGDLETDVVEETTTVRKSLERLTGELPGRSPKDWIAWWQKNGAKWRSEDLSRPKTGEEAVKRG